MRLEKLLKPFDDNTRIELYNYVKNNEKPLYRGPVCNCPLWYLKKKIDYDFYSRTEFNGTVVIWIE